MPSDVLPVEKMKLVMRDMHIADALAETKAQAGGNEKALTMEYYAQIYKNYGITESEFNTSYKFYQQNPAWMDKLYAEVLTELSKKEADVSK